MHGRRRNTRLMTVRWFRGRSTRALSSCEVGRANPCCRIRRAVMIAFPAGAVLRDRVASASSSRIDRWLRETLTEQRFVFEENIPYCMSLSNGQTFAILRVHEK
jgi:hypothetical protein